MANHRHIGLGFLVFLFLFPSSTFGQSGFDLRKDLKRKYLQQRRKVLGVKRDARFITRELDRGKKSVAPLTSEAEGFIPANMAANDSTDTLIAPNVNRKGMIGNYHKIYNFLNLSAPVSLDTVPSYIEDGNNMLHPEIEVFGWHPHWLGESFQSYNFNLLSIASFFSYDIDPKTGGNRNAEAIELWKNSAFVDSAQAHGCRALLTITNHGRNNNRLFLDNYLAQSQLMDQALALVKEKGASGLDINFENIPKGQRNNFSLFIQELRTRISKENPNYMITVTLPAFDYNQAFDIAAIEPYVDLFVIMGYDYNGPFGNSIGPISPLKDKIGGLEKALAYYINNGMPPQKLLMGFPYFGGLWERNKTEDGNEFFFKRHLTYSQIRTKYADVDVNFDSTSVSMYFVTDNPTGTEECWFDNEYSLGKKYDWALDQGLGGIGIWALGYDHGYPELWQLIDQKMTIDSEVLYNDQQATHTVFFNLIQSMRKYKSVILTSIFMLLGFMVIGFTFSLFDWRVREALFNSHSIRFYFIALVFIALISGFVMFRWFENSTINFILGLILGSLITYGVTMIYGKKKDELP